MNLESLKAGFMSYLAEKLEEEGKEITSQDLNLSDVSIFMYGNEFKEYLVRECNADASIFSKSMNEIMNMDFVNGELVESFDDESSPQISNEDITAFLNSVNDLDNIEYDLNTNGAVNAGLPAVSGSEAQGMFSSAPDSTVSNGNQAENLPVQDSEFLQTEIEPETLLQENSGIDGGLQPEIPDTQIESDSTDLTDGIITDSTDAETDEILPDDSGFIDDEIISGEDALEEDIASELEEFYENPEVLSALDYDKDGILSDEEKSRFEDYIKNNYSETGDISKDDLDKILQEIKDGKFEYDNAPAEDSKFTDSEEIKPDDADKADAPASQPAPSNGGGGVSGGGMSGGGGGGGISGGGGASSASSSPAVIDDSMSLEELESEKTAREGELSDAQSELSDVYSGQDSEVKDAQDDYDEKEKEYQEAVESDPALEEYKEEIEANLEEIDNAQKDIDTSKAQVSECETNINSQESTISGLEAQLAGAQAAAASYSGDLSGEQKANQEAAQAEVTRLENEISDAKDKLEEYKQQKEEAEQSLSDAETRLSEAEDKKAELDKIVSETASRETKEALDAYNEAKDNLSEVKESRASSVQSDIDSIQSDISKLDEQINELKQKETESEFSNFPLDMDVNLQENLTDAQKAELAQIKNIYKQNESVYKDIAEQVKADTGVSLPAEAICAIHFRESSCNFNTYLHNGEKLGQVTTLVPAGIYFDNFRDAAVDALERELDSAYTESCSKYGVKNDCSTMSSVLMFCERYNGFGYRNHGCQSAYVYSGTTEYTGGMYVSDGNFSASERDPRCGTAVIIKELMNV